MAFINDNEKINYDLSLGSLYDYDANKYLYDESIFGEYQTHSGVELFGKEDYEKLEDNLKQLSDQQLANGYIVNEFNIVYIIVISAIATLCEAFSYGGIDNLTVPAVTSILYYLVAVM